MKQLFYVLTIFLILGLTVFLFTDRRRGVLKPSVKIERKTIGKEIDNFNGVSVYYNGGFSNVSGRNVTKDGYNLGLKYQCVEFVKRYYYQYLNHKMPDSYGHAKDFFDKSLKDGQKNRRRNLVQYRNPSRVKPKVNDLVIFDGSFYNKFGHVAIISKVTSNKIEIIQQNTGRTRDNISIYKKGGEWYIGNNQILGWLRKE